MRKSRGQASAAAAGAKAGQRQKKPLIGRLIRGAEKAKEQVEQHEIERQTRRVGLKAKVARGAAMVQEAMSDDPRVQQALAQAGADGGMAEAQAGAAADAEKPRKRGAKGLVKKALVKAVKKKLAKDPG